MSNDDQDNREKNDEDKGDKEEEEENNKEEPLPPLFGKGKGKAPPSESEYEQSEEDVKLRLAKTCKGKGKVKAPSLDSEDNSDAAPRPVARPVAPLCPSPLPVHRKCCAQPPLSLDPFSTRGNSGWSPAPTT